MRGPEKKLRLRLSSVRSASSSHSLSEAIDVEGPWFEVELGPAALLLLEVALGIGLDDPRMLYSSASGSSTMSFHRTVFVFFLS